MTTKPKTPRFFVVRRTTIAQAIKRHKATLAACDAVPGPEDIPEHLIDAEVDALEELAFTPCAGDAEFLEKLRYLYNSQQAKSWPLPVDGDNFGCLAIAAACHFCPVPA